MKLATLILAFIPAALGAQTLVSTSPQLRTAVLEEFTAINCGNCPAGHVVAAGLEAQYGNDLSIIGIHGGSLAEPMGAQPDLRTTDGTALWTYFNVFGQPTATVNRGPVQTSSFWAAAVQNTLAQSSPVNIGALSTFDPTSMMLTVEVELYYTGTGLPSDDRIHLALTEDHIVGWQTDYANGNQSNYDHMHVLRDLITPLAGDLVSTTSIGTLVQRIYMVAVDPDWDMAQSHVVAYVSEENGEVYQAVEVDASGEVNTSINEVLVNYRGLGLPYPMPAVNELIFPLEPTTELRRFALVDIRGLIVYEEQLEANAGEIRLDVAQLNMNTGLYFASIDEGAARKVQIFK